jgi:hypothetical protein
MECHDPNPVLPLPAMVGIQQFSVSGDFIEHGYLK